MKSLIQYVEKREHGIFVQARVPASLVAQAKQACETLNTTLPNVIRGCLEKFVHDADALSSNRPKPQQMNFDPKSNW